MSQTQAQPALDQDYAYCAEQLYQHDWDSWLSCLFAPAAVRSHLHALFAFSSEIKRIPLIVSEPGLGEIRLQWWRDALFPAPASISPFETGGQGHPLANAVLETIKTYQLPLQPFQDLIEAHVFDLYQDPMQSMSDLEGYYGETIASVLRLASLILAQGQDPGGADCVGHAGVALGLIDLLQSLSRHAARGQIYLPKDVIIKHQLDPQSLLKQQMCPALERALREICDLARQHRTAALSNLGSLQPAARSVLLGLARVEPFLARFERRGCNPFEGPVTVPAWKRQWHVFRMSLNL